MRTRRSRGGWVMQMDADTLQELRTIRAMLAIILVRRQLGHRDAVGAVERLKAAMDGIINRAERAQDATTGGA